MIDESILVIVVFLEIGFLGRWVWPVGILAGQEIPVRSGFSDVDVAVS
jgi:hypothetical protein